MTREVTIPRSFGSARISGINGESEKVSGVGREARDVQTGGFGPIWNVPPLLEAANGDWERCTQIKALLKLNLSTFMSVR